MVVKIHQECRTFFAGYRSNFVFSVIFYYLGDFEREISQPSRLKALDIVTLKKSGNNPEMNIITCFAYWLQRHRVTVWRFFYKLYMYMR